MKMPWLERDKETGKLVKKTGDKTGKPHTKKSKQDHADYCLIDKCNQAPPKGHVTPEDVITGRRVVEWGVLLEELTRGCHSCGLGPLTLSLFSVVGELVKGLGGYLYVECSVCRFISRIKTQLEIYCMNMSI